MPFLRFHSRLPFSETLRVGPWNLHSDGKASVYNVRDLGSIPGLGRFPGEGNGNPLQYFLPWKSHGPRSLVQATIHGVTKSWARLSDFTSLQVAPRIPGFYHILSRMSVERCLFLSLSKKNKTLEPSFWLSSVLHPSLIQILYSERWMMLIGQPGQPHIHP